MLEISVPIGHVFRYVESLGVRFPYDEDVVVPFDLDARVSRDSWTRVPSLIKKRATLHRIEFESGAPLWAADDHLVSVDAVGSDFVYVKDVPVGYVFEYAGRVVKSNVVVGVHDVFSFQVDTEKHVYRDAYGLVHHNTYSCKKAAERGVKRNPDGAKLVVASGDVGSAPSDTIFILWKYRHNYVLLLDDCDSMLKSRSQTVANILKAALDPDVKPISAGGYAVRKLVQNKIDADPELNPSGLSKKEQLKLAKQRETDKVDDKADAKARAERIRKAIDDEKIKTSSGVEPLPKKKTGHLKWSWVNGKGVLVRESIDDEDGFEEPMTIEQKEEAKVFDVDQEFVFDSSVVFISNLDFEDVNSAVRDRCLPAEIRLTREEFMIRLEVVLDGLCKENKSTSTLSQETLDWAKRNAYSMLKALVEAERKATPLFKDKKRVVINRQLTFRSIDDLVSMFLNVEKVLEKTRPGFAALVDKDERSKAMTSQFAREAVEYLAATATA